MKTLYLAIIVILVMGISYVTDKNVMGYGFCCAHTPSGSYAKPSPAESLNNSDMACSTPEGVGNGPYSYTDNTAQLQFTIPAIIAIISVVIGIAIYAASRSIRK